MEVRPESASQSAPEKKLLPPSLPEQSAMDTKLTRRAVLRVLAGQGAGLIGTSIITEALNAQKEETTNKTLRHVSLITGFEGILLLGIHRLFNSDEGKPYQISYDRRDLYPQIDRKIKRGINNISNKRVRKILDKAATIYWGVGKYEQELKKHEVSPQPDQMR